MAKPIIGQDILDFHGQGVGQGHCPGLLRGPGSKGDAQAVMVDIAHGGQIQHLVQLGSGVADEKEYEQDALAG